MAYDDSAHGGSKFEVSSKDIEKQVDKEGLVEPPVPEEIDGIDSTEYKLYLKNAQEQSPTFLAAFFNLTCSIVGTGALSLPYGLGKMGWGPGMFFLIFGTFVTYYCARKLAEVSEYKGYRFTTYRHISTAILGKQFTNWFVIPLQFATIMITLATCGILGGQALQAIALQYGPTMTLPKWVAVYGSAQVALSFIPTMKHLSYSSLLAVICAMIYTVVAVAGSLHDGLKSDPPPRDYGLSPSMTDRLFGFFQGISIMATAFGTACLPEIQGALETPSAPRMKKAITGCWTIILVTYTIIGVTGYWTYGNAVQANVLISLSGPRWAIVLGLLAAVLQICTSIQVYANVIFDVPERMLRDTSKPLWGLHNFGVRCLIRLPGQILAVFISALLPFLGDFASLLGIGFVMMDFVMPAVFHLVAKKPKRWGLLWCADYAFAIIYSVVSLIGLIASVRAIVEDAKTYQVFSNSG